jgi:YgiT-type zinc finger domain-containing protein
MRSSACEREVDFDDVRRILDERDTIEEYPDDTPYPSCLLLGWIGSRPLHIVMADDGPDGVVVITVYDPNPAEWTSDFRPNAMKCVICKHGETRPGKATLSATEGDCTLVVKDVPADICSNCGEEYLSEDVGRRVSALLDEMLQRGVEVDVRRFEAA